MNCMDSLDAVNTSITAAMDIKLDINENAERIPRTNNNPLVIFNIKRLGIVSPPKADAMYPDGISGWQRHVQSVRAKSVHPC